MKWPVWPLRPLWRMPESLAVRVFWLYAISISIAALSSVGLLTRQEFVRHIEDSLQSVKKIADLSLPRLRDSALIGDYDTIRRTLQDMVPDSPLAGAVYLDSDGGTLAASADLRSPGAPRWLTTMVAARLPAVSKEISVGGRRYGELQLSFDSDHIAGQLWDLILRSAALSLAGLGLGFGLMRYLLRRWLGNLDRLQGYEARVLAGDTSAQALLADDAPLEIRRAIDVINRTSGSLREQFGLRINSLTNTLLQHKQAVDSAAAVIELDPQGHLVDVNDAFAEVLGQRRQQLLGRPLAALGELQGDAWQPCAHIWHGEVALRNAQGRLRWHRRSVVPTFDADQRIEKYICIDIDITDQKVSEQGLRDQIRLQKLITDFGSEALSDDHLDKLMHRAVEVACQGLNASHAALVSQSPAEAVPRLVAGLGWAKGWVGKAMSTSDKLLPQDMLDEHGIKALLIQPQTPGRTSGFCIAVGFQAERDLADAERYFLSSLTYALAAATDRNRSREHLTYLAQFDSLTGLPNRSLLLDRLQTALATARRQGSRLGLIYLDLDRFKQVNDTLGHEAGDQLLIQAGIRMAACLRASDTVARLSGDEFALLLPGLDNLEDAERVARKVLAQLLKPFVLNGKQAYISASLGAAIYPDDASSAESLIQCADQAMYCSKDAGRNEFHFFRREMGDAAVAKIEFENLLRQAVANDQFFLLYQPKVDLATGAICGLEALLRWRHPVRGIISPADFIAVLEETGLITEVGRWVLRSVAEQIVQWQKSGLTVPRVSLNLSPRQFSSADLDSHVRATLNESGVDPALIEFELTESLLMQDPARAAVLLDRFRSYGLRLSIDDFGTGYSSLAYLTRFPVDVLKVDKAFVQGLIGRPEDATITWAIIQLAHSLHLQVVAEGVETAEQVDMLVHHGCDVMQGYYFSPPVAADWVADMLRQQHRLHWHPAQNTPKGGFWRKEASSSGRLMPLAEPVLAA